VLVTCKSWPQRAAFLAALRRHLAAAPQRVPYYPGAADKYDAFKASFTAAGVAVQVESAQDEGLQHC
jgi:hypothetical protein